MRERGRQTDRQTDRQTEEGWETRETDKEKITNHIRQTDKLNLTGRRRKERETRKETDTEIETNAFTPTQPLQEKQKFRCCRIPSRQNHAINSAQVEAISLLQHTKLFPEGNIAD